MACDSVVRQLAHVPFGWRPTRLRVTVRRYRCVSCGRVWRQDTRAEAEPRAKISRAALRWRLGWDRGSTLIDGAGCSGSWRVLVYRE